MNNFFRHFTSHHFAHTIPCKKKKVDLTELDLCVRVCLYVMEMGALREKLIHHVYLFLIFCMHMQ